MQNTQRESSKRFKRDELERNDSRANRIVRLHRTRGRPRRGQDYVSRWTVHGTIRTELVFNLTTTVTIKINGIDYNKRHDDDDDANRELKKKTCKIVSKNIQKRNKAESVYSETMEKKTDKRHDTTLRRKRSEKGEGIRVV